jgi:predicted esterase
MAALLVRSIATTIHGRYVLALPETGRASAVVIGFHGYGERAEQLLAHLSRLRGAGSLLLVGVQALHRFYRRQTSEVVGSWMTRLDRDEAIADNIEYVARVTREVLAMREAHGPLLFAGFSQGAAMAYRAAASLPACRGVVVLGGDLPPEVDPDVLARQRTGVLIGRGAADEWYTAAKLAADVERLRAAGVEVERHEHDAGHEWSDAFLERLGGFVGRQIGAGPRGLASDEPGSGAEPRSG